MTIAEIESLDHEGRGVAHVAGKTIFIEGALPHERVRYASYRKKPSFEMAQVTEIIQAGFARTEPGCDYFKVCGGCSMQHLEPAAQVAAKQRILEDNLWHIGKVKPMTILPAIYGPSWGYRYRARLSARLVEKKGGMLVGFHERHSRYIADMQHCKILPPRISDLLMPLRELLGQLSIKDRIPQIELAIGEAVDVLVLRVMEVLTSDDEAKLKQFADNYSIQFWLQPKGPETAHPFYPLTSPELNYRLPEFNLTMPFRPTEFTQVNPAMNRVLVGRAMQLLDPQPQESIADLFCGLGNFSLPIARRGAKVVGVEGSAGLVERATHNAAYNGLAHLTQFKVADLFKVTSANLAEWGQFDKMLIDPPRDGAIELVNALAENGPQRIVYVSCNPATLARDASILVKAQGYQLQAAGVVNMFPHTAHVESIALFEKA